MKTYEERTADILRKIQVGKKNTQIRKRVTAMAVSAVCLIAILAVLFIPYPENLPDVSAYKNSPYYDVIQKISLNRYRPPRDKNNFETLVRVFSSLGAKGGDHMVDADGMVSGTGSYVEVTDNQVEGVVEADLIKRTDQYIYYLSDLQLYVYRIAGEESALIGKYRVFEEGNSNGTYEMYLSQDCKTLTVMGYYSDPKVRDSGCVRVKTMRIENGYEITEGNEIYISGNYLSSRLVKDKLLLMTKYHISTDLDYSDESTFLPQVGTPGNMKSLDPDDILSPEVLTSTHYTVVTMLDSNTLELADATALLSYSPELYVYQNHIFATRNFTVEEKLDSGMAGNTAMTEVICLGYTGDQLEKKGSFYVEGTLKNQYSMDEKDGVLRLVTTTTTNVVTHYTNGTVASQTIETRARNANLYCVSIGDWEILAEIEGFAPPGEEVRSVRFDGDQAYVCTSVVFSDPVFFFDLSDLKNITWKDTGTIEGYSSSLVNFGNGYLLGVGYGGSREFKIEVYQETESGVTPICKYTRNVTGFSENYKSYFIDRENQLIGLGIDDYTASQREGKYILLHFDGYELRVMSEQDLIGLNEDKRGVVIGDYLYVMWADVFKVCKVW